MRELRVPASTRDLASLRFVQEYRGRRIVTDGKLFGIHAEPTTDFRYLGLTGAQRAIDSELTLEASRAQRAGARARRISVPSVAYFEDYRKRSFSCKCGWLGGYDDLTRCHRAAAWS
jgi:hypothetical protein